MPGPAGVRSAQSFRTVGVQVALKKFRSVGVQVNLDGAFVRERVLFARPWTGSEEAGSAARAQTRQRMKISGHPPVEKSLPKRHGQPPVRRKKRKGRSRRKGAGARKRSWIKWHTRRSFASRVIARSWRRRRARKRAQEDADDEASKTVTATAVAMEMAADAGDVAAETATVTKTRAAADAAAAAAAAAASAAAAADAACFCCCRC